MGALNRQTDEETLMDAKLIAALACAAALALGGCSGGNPPAPAAPETTNPATPSDPDPGPAETTDPPADGMTEAERFDKKLKEAEDNLAAARRMAAAAATTSTGIAAARKALTDALAAARALQAPSGDSERIALAGRLDLKADAAEAEYLPRLRAAESRAGWPASALVIGRESLRPVPALSGVSRTVRRNADGPTDDALKDADIPAVMYEDGKVVMSPGLSSSGDRLRMRGIPVYHLQRSTTAPEHPIVALRPDGRRFLYTAINSSPRFLVDRDSRTSASDPQTNDEDPLQLVAGLRITPSGLVVDMGGKGAQGVDFRPPDRFASSLFISATSGSAGSYDLKLPFGPPNASPEGNAEHYWTASLPATDAHRSISLISSLLGRDGLGIYTMRLSNHAGLDRNLEDPDDPAASARDDVNHYLSYAAYGHMEFVDSFNGASGIVPTRRTFPFHVGYDAFKDEAGMRTTDVAAADKITEGTFKGRTMASQFTLAVSLQGTFPVLSGANYLRLRGDVKLTATISGTAADNRISGMITNLESWNTASSQWENYARIPGTLTLQSTGISASGSFAGVIPTPAASLPNFDEGGYRGNLYGPLADLEAAGIWYLQDANRTDFGLKLSVVGSFGAARVRDDYTYGTVVGPSGD